MVASMPVLFIDQVSSKDENPQKGLFGETFHLRKLFAPGGRRAASDDAVEQLIRVDHFSLDEVSPEELQRRAKRSRLVVLGGITAPTDEAVDVLWQYVIAGRAVGDRRGREVRPDAMDGHRLARRRRHSPGAASTRTGRSERGGSYRQFIVVLSRLRHAQTPRLFLLAGNYPRP